MLINLSILGQLKSASKLTLTCRSAYVCRAKAFKLGNRQYSCDTVDRGEATATGSRVQLDQKTGFCCNADRLQP